MRKISILFRAMVNLLDHYGIEMAGYMAFLSILSIFPFLIFIVTLFGFVGGMEAGSQFVEFIMASIPKNIAVMVDPRVREIMTGPPMSILTISIIGVIWTASSSFEGIRGVLNIIYKVKSPPSYLLRRMMSLLEFFIVCVVIVVASFISFVIPSLIDYLSSMLDQDHAYTKLIIKIIEFNTNYIQEYKQIAIIASMALMVIFMYYKIPSTKVRFREILPGSMLTVVGWFFAGDLLQRYITNFSQMNLVYGGLAGVIGALLFFFIIHLIWIFGAELNFLLYRDKKS